mmetsp:Transcript_22907/g.46664  ORF Transcript_22907/g.46664 Transcript_22907/m.46664 type:complete len:90 (+) Transcript_22907:103-372(+)|eukprot:CAMPEP_0119057948 /NCGR_PEP_ID=MMETSP1178-20130426/2342_1 /TAXON_ID=33656 /ORGANISM="unid sp, Strain CCMP2000" /LENGTH=89 /DNA_ID=CAMNT_0007038829 /DNA_START=103 /DNA_END=372 /DNA_ORIENTATION=+
MTDHTAPLIAKLTDLLATSHVSVVDVSDGCGAKFEAIIVSDKFDGVPLLERHRMVHDALSEEMPQIHALQMKTWTPAQYEAKCAKDGQS